MRLGALGKSGSTIFMSEKRNFVIKTLPKVEMNYFCARFEAYHQYIINHPNSLLPAFLGLYRLRTRKKLVYILVTNVGECFFYPRSTVHFIFDLCVPVYPSDAPIERIYDLKGSSAGRSATEQEKEAVDCIYKVRSHHSLTRVPFSQGPPIRITIFWLTGDRCALETNARRRSPSCRRTSSF